MLKKLSRRLFPPTQVIDGYENPELVDAVVRKTRAYKPSDWLDIGGAETVLDFGGGSGRHYKEARSPRIKWAVVETPTMVSKATALGTEHLRFFTDTERAVSWLGRIDLMHSNGAIQYTDDPLRTVEHLVSIGAKEMRWFRLHLSDEADQDDQISFLSDNGPGTIALNEKLVKYRRRAITEHKFLIAHARYNLVAQGADWFSFKA